MSQLHRVLARAGRMVRGHRYAEPAEAGSNDARGRLFASKNCDGVSLAHWTLDASDTPGVVRSVEAGRLDGKHLESWTAPFRTFAIGDETIDNPRIQVV
jgi:hypothetical protein